MDQKLNGQLVKAPAKEDFSNKRILGEENTFSSLYMVTLGANALKTQTIRMKKHRFPTVTDDGQTSGI